MSSTDVVNLIRQKEGLLRKLADFEVTNKALRKLLKEQSRYEVGALHLVKTLACQLSYNSCSRLTRTLKLTKFLYCTNSRLSIDINLSRI